MIRKITLVILSFLVLVSCFNLDEISKNDTNNSVYKLFNLSVSLVAPEGFEGINLEGVEVKLTELNNGFEYTKVCNYSGVADFMLPIGVYRATVSAQILEDQFNSSISGIILNEKINIDIPLTLSKTSDLLIKEIYCGGCTKYPEQGTYDYDNYIIIHNNSKKIQYLDSLCFGTLDPYNSNGNIVWSNDDINTFAPLIQAIWMFGGDGKSHPLQPGEDAVIALKEAINHRATYPLSVNLDKPGYYAAYNSTFFPGTTNHPMAAPGNNIPKDNILECVIKMGQANTYTFSKNSPAIVIFRPIGMSIYELLGTEGRVVQKPSTTVDRIMKVPIDMIIDGVEVFNGQSTTNKKRLGAAVDASYITLSNTNEGKSLCRKVNEVRTEAFGFEVLCDTNNSGDDFVELPEASLRK